MYIYIYKYMYEYSRTRVLHSVLQDTPTLVKMLVFIVNVIIIDRRMKQAPYRHLPKGKMHMSIKTPAYRKSFLHTQVLLLSGLPEPSRVSGAPKSLASP